MRLLVCWARPSGYSTAFFRRLSERHTIHVVFEGPEGHSNAPFNDEQLVGNIQATTLPKPRWTAVNGSGRAAVNGVSDLAAELRPDALFVSGWANDVYRGALNSEVLRAVPAVLALDNPFIGSRRQLAGRWLRHAFFRHFAVALVPGERAATLARYLMPHAPVITGLYGVDTDRWARALRVRSPDTRRLPFLFVGRAEKEKGADLLAAGYRLYSRRRPDARNLRVVGSGPLLSLFGDSAKTEVTGFVQPADLLGYFADAAALVLPSRYDPWPLALLEAAASGLPLCASRACGNGAELLREGYNGVFIDELSPSGVADALARLDELLSNPSAGEFARQLAAPYSLEQTEARWLRAATVAQRSGDSS